MSKDDNEFEIYAEGRYGAVHFNLQVNLRCGLGMYHGLMETLTRYDEYIHYLIWSRKLQREEWDTIKDMYNLNGMDVDRVLESQDVCGDKLDMVALLVGEDHFEVEFVVDNIAKSYKYYTPKDDGRHSLFSVTYDA